MHMGHCCRHTNWKGLKAILIQSAVWLSSKIVSGSFYGTLCIWDVATTQVRHTYLVKGANLCQLCNDTLQKAPEFPVWTMYLSETW